MNGINLMVVVLYSTVGFMRSGAKRCVLLVIDGVNSGLDAARWCAVKSLQAVGTVIKFLLDRING